MDGDGLPSICEQCLAAGDIRMTRVPHGAECKVCTQPFTLYHFKVGGQRRPTKTLVCRGCAEQRNMCQCCMLDLTWHVPMQLRDEIVSLVQGTDESTVEGSNDMVKRFLALKKGKLGGAQFTGDSGKLGELISRLREVVGSPASAKQLTTTGTTTGTTPAAAGVMDTEGKLPFAGGLATADTRSFFIYGIDPSLAEWEIADAISQLVHTTDWQDRSTVAIVVRHEARCGGVRFKNEDLARSFVTVLDKFQSQSALQRGVFRIRHFRMHVVDWPNFNVAALGTKTKQWLQIARIVNTIMQADIVASTKDVSGPSEAAGSSGKVIKRRKPPKKIKKSKRLAGLEL
ncbi:Pre-mRNA-splicing factor ECM2 Ecym_2656 [Eremothecium cymbalariae DBVPG|uniref:Pre-mRNA-splicing factor SLT11 n=1 Tax=Eremothecium cymbalariae (strain CBS 270.75 / DBVPG 7215 / KCTC 17166 / NRRL Y-17582) TaxID=931890 RepID=G8JNU2_ERECY|nr:Hypothetical protein Ecym_2656 [Eremothecium cymbalariae DBVPG\